MQTTATRVGLGLLLGGLTACSEAPTAPKAPLRAQATLPSAAAIQEAPVPGLLPVVPDGSTRSSVTTLPCPKGATLKVEPQSVACVDAQGALEGPGAWFDAEGRLQEAGWSAGGQRTGVWQAWAPTGGRISVTSYAEGLKDGLEIVWWPNGKRKKEATYQANVLQGMKKEWGEDGRLTVVETYGMGVLSEQLTFGPEGRAQRTTP